MHRSFGVADNGGWGLIRKTILITVLSVLAAFLLAGCAGADDPDCPRETVADRSTVAPFEPAADGSNYREYVDRNLSAEEMAEAAASPSPYNFWESLNVPTCITRIGGIWFLADCYHNQILWSDAEYAPQQPLTSWRVLTVDVTQPHTIAAIRKLTGRSCGMSISVAVAATMASDAKAGMIMSSLRILLYVLTDINIRYARNTRHTAAQVYPSGLL